MLDADRDIVADADYLDLGERALRIDGLDRKIDVL